MATKYGKFEMPTEIKVEADPQDPNAAVFVAEPFEKGFGHTIGNSLRRVLLSSIEAPAIISIKIEGVPHEYMAIEGIIEDMTHIVLNFKGALLKKLTSDSESHPKTIQHITKELDITAEQLGEKGQYEVTLGDIIQDARYEVINPELHLFTVTKPMKKRIDVKVQSGRGYVPSEAHEIENKVVDEIVVDSTFTPVTMVNYHIEKTRVGRDTDFDKLILKVETDGRVAPDTALTFAAQLVTEHLSSFANVNSAANLSLESGETGEETDRDQIMQRLVLRVNEVELSVRSMNCLAGAGIETIGELVLMPESDLLKFRNFGRKSLNEIKQKLTDMGLSLGMDLSRYDVRLDNVKEKIQAYLAKQAGKNA